MEPNGNISSFSPEAFLPGSVKTERRSKESPTSLNTGPFSSIIIIIIIIIIVVVVIIFIFIFSLFLFFVVVVVDIVIIIIMI